MDLFSLIARLKLDKSQYEKGMDEAVSEGRSFGDKLKGALGTAAKVGAAAIGAATTAAGVLLKQSVDQYANYEQLVGGVETLFKNSAGQVQYYADMAYKTAGLSANQYMETVTSFSASLLQSLGGDTKKAADMADMAIIDMADNANKMGSDMASIQNAYSGFAKQNFTMLDNLKLGYGGTKEEMERLLADAEKLSGQKFDISSYADIVQAIHVVQTEMGITGTTAKEASETISGSLASMKSAWDNLVTGLGRDDDMLDEYINNFVDSAVTVAGNLIPRVEKILVGMTKLVEKMGPVIADKLPGLVQVVLPALLSTGISLVQSLTKSIPSVMGILLDAIITNLPAVVQTGLEILVALAQGIAENLPTLIPTIVSVVLQIVDILTQPDTLSSLIVAAVAIIVALAEGLIQAMPQLLEKGPVIVVNLVTAIIQNAPKLLEAGIQLIATFARGIIESFGTVTGAIRKLLDSVWSNVADFIQGAWDWGRDLIDNFTAGIRAFINKPIDAIRGLAGKIKSFLGFSEPEEGPLSNFHTYAPDMMKLFAEGIEGNRKLITDAINDTFTLPDNPKGPAGGQAGQEIIVPRSAGDGGRDMTIIFRLSDDTELGRAVYRLYNNEEQRVGVRLAGGMA